LTAVAVPEPAPLVVSIGGLAFIAFTRIVRRRGAAGN